jgi:hypothetical protein
MLVCCLDYSIAGFALFVLLFMFASSCCVVGRRSKRVNPERGGGKRE